MSSTLYRKYRPQKFSEIIGQAHIVQTLSNAIKNNRLGQAYLFTGPRGTGKTTLARVFAKAINCTKRNGFEPCNQCEVCRNINEGRSLDIIEIDAASNTGVENIRELKEAVKLPPTQAKYKVYIIDEVHMLSAGAFNALLKTLEEPPAHVIFILATTEIHKVPETILSRCQRFDFSRLSLEQITKKLADIAKLEKVNIEKDALELIAVSAEGGMRDAESLLAQIIALEDKNITAREVEEILGAARHESVEKMADFMLEKRAGEALNLANKLSAEGVNFEVFYKSLLNYLRQMMIVSVNVDLAKLFSLELTKEQLKNITAKAQNYTSKEILTVLENLIEAKQNIRSSFIPSLPLEIAIIRSVNSANNQQSATSQSPQAARNKLQSNNQEFSNNQFSISNKVANNNDQKKETDTQNTKYKTRDAKITIDKVKDKWIEIVAATKPHNHSLMAFLANCEPVKIEDNELIIATKYNLYKDKLNNPQNRLTVEKVITKILNCSVSAKFITEEEAGITIAKPQTASHRLQAKSENRSLLNDALNIIGGRIVE